MRQEGGMEAEGWRDLVCAPPASHPQRMGEERGGGGGPRCVQDKKRSLLGTGLISGEGGGGPLGHDNDCRTLATARRSAPRRRLPRPGGLSKLL